MIIVQLCKYCSINIELLVFADDTKRVCMYKTYSWSGESVWLSAQRQNINNCSTPFVWKPETGMELPVIYSNWSSGEPNCGKDKEECVHVSPGKAYGWNDVSCDTKMCSLCQYDPW